MHAAMIDEALPAFVALVREIASRAAAAGPLPRGWGLLGLDHVGTTSLEQLAGVARHGIFRKYEQVLFLEGGLGAPARWAATQLGCTAISTTRSRVEASHGGRLTASAGLGDGVAHLVGASERLPVRDASVTHVWAVESLGTLESPTGALGEACRVVRPGGQLAILEAVSGSGTVGVAGRSLEPAARWVERVREVGFVDVAAVAVDDAIDQVGARVAAARTQLATRLADSNDASLRGVAESLGAITSGRATGRLRVVRILARRP